MESRLICLLFFSNDPPTTEIYTLSLHDALPIFGDKSGGGAHEGWRAAPSEDDRMVRRREGEPARRIGADRKSTRLNSSHRTISYAVFCLKKKKTTAPTHCPEHASSTHPPATVKH